MSHTVDLAENPSVEVTREVFEARPPDRIAFEAEGTVRMSEALLGEFEGTTLQPVGVAVSVEGSETVTVDLDSTASLQLESIDVGVETPDIDDLPDGADDVSDGVDAVRSAGGDGDSPDAPTGSIAFTVEGTIRDVPEATVERLADGDASLASVTFGVEESAMADGGEPSDVLLEVGLLGYGLVVHRDGTVEIRAGGEASEFDTDLGLR